MHTNHSVVIARPCAEVFEFVTDLRNEVRWQPEIMSVELDGPLRVGASFRETRVSFGRSFDWLFRITEFQQNHRISIETIEARGASPFPYRGSRMFEELGDGRTRVTETGDLRVPWPLRIVDPLLGRLAAAPVREAYDRLRVLLEIDCRERRREPAGAISAC